MRRSRSLSIALVVSIAAILGGFEAGMVFAVKVNKFDKLTFIAVYIYIYPPQPSYETGDQRPVRAFGLLGSVLLALALL